jgi:hypothetical protein
MNYYCMDYYCSEIFDIADDLLVLVRKMWAGKSVKLSTHEAWSMKNQVVRVLEKCEFGNPKNFSMFLSACHMNTRQYSRLTSGFGQVS